MLLLSIGINFNMNAQNNNHVKTNENQQNGSIENVSYYNMIIYLKGIEKKEDNNARIRIDHFFRTYQSENQLEIPNETRIVGKNNDIEYYYDLRKIPNPKNQNFVDSAKNLFADNPKIRILINLFDLRDLVR